MVFYLARRARRFCQIVAEKYNYQSNLTGLCALGSCRLSHLLKKRQIEHTIEYTWGHVFNVVDGTIVDVTSEQFGLPEIHTEPFPSPRRIYKSEQSFKSIKRLCRRLETEGWDRTQIYTNFLSGDFFI